MAPAKKKKPKAPARKKPPKKKKKPVGAAGGQSELNIKAIKFQCLAGTCDAVPRARHMNQGDLVFLYATNTGVTITFTAGSPFISGTTQIVLPQGGIAMEIVSDSIPHNTPFPYNLVCTKPLCAILQAPPQMIVD
jgi:hypothetical protein